MPPAEGVPYQSGEDEAVFRVRDALDMLGLPEEALGFPASSLATELIEQAAESQYHIEQVRKLKAEAFERGLISGSHPFADAPWEESLAPGLDWQRLERY